MTIESRSLEQTMESEEEVSDADMENDNSENISPMTGQLMNHEYTLPYPNKMMISTPTKHLLLGDHNSLNAAVNAAVQVNESKESPKSETGLYVKQMSDSNSLPCSPIRKLSQSVDSGELRTALDKVKTKLSSSCFAEISSSRTSDVDSDLTCLNWLQEGNLLNGFSPGALNSKKIKTEKKCKQPDLNLNSSDPLNYIKAIDHSLRKPSYSFSTLIFMAIENSSDKKLPVKEIYQWIQDNFPYFQKAPLGWKNSVRHNLSLNKSFKKVDKEKCIGKGSLWTIDHEARAGLVQQLRKTAAYNTYPYTKTAYSTNRYLSTKDKTIYKRDAAGRFLPNHDDAEFDVAATMCSMGTPMILKHYEQRARQSVKHDHKASLNLLRKWRTYIEPYDTAGKGERQNGDATKHTSKTKYSMGNFIDEVKHKLSFDNHCTKKEKVGDSLDTSLDDDYEFMESDDEISDDDDEMNVNLRRLIEQDDRLVDSGYCEEGTFKNATLLDHSYSRRSHALDKQNSAHFSKHNLIKAEDINAVAGLLDLANAASKELEKITSVDKGTISNIIVPQQCNIASEKTVISSKEDILCQGLPLHKNSLYLAKDETLGQVN